MKFPRILLKILKNFFIFCAWLLISIILILVVIIIGNRFNYPNGFSLLVVSSDEMKPTLYKDYLALSLKSTNYQKGDLIRLNSGKIYNEHAIRRIEALSKNNNDETVYQIKVDGKLNLQSEDTILKKEIDGKIFLILPQAGMYFKLIDSKEGMIGLVAMIVFLTFILNIGHIINFFRPKPRFHIKPPSSNNKSFQMRVSLIKKTISKINTKTKGKSVDSLSKKNR
jgi:signal peptidase I